MGVLESRLALWLTAVLLAFTADARPSSHALPLSRAGPSFQLSELEPGVFVHEGRQLPLDVPGHDDIANIGFIVGDRCVAVIDTGGSAATGRELRAAVRRHTPLAICYVINTHVHADHVLGNSAFKIDGPSFVGHSALKEAIDRNREFFLDHFAHDLDPPPAALQVIGPDRLVEGELELDLGGRLLTLRAWPKAHTDCDLTVFDVKTRTLWTGDLLFRGRLPALDGSVRGWLKVLADLELTSVRLAVPGHGPPARELASAIAPERRYLQALLDGVREDLAQNTPPLQAIARVAAGEKTRWLLWDSVHPHNVMQAYQELEWE